MFGSGSLFGGLSLRPTGPSNLAQQQQMPLIGGQQQPQMQQAAALTPSTGGRIPVSGATNASLDALFKEADKMAAQPSGGSMVNGQFQPDQTTQDAYRDWKTYNSLYQFGNSYGADLNRLMGNTGTGYQGALTPETKARQKMMDQMVLSGMSYSDVLKNMGVTPKGDGSGQSAASTAAQKEAEAFLKSLGLGGSSTSGGSSGGSSGTNTQRTQNTQSNTQSLSAAATNPTEPGRIPVSTGTAATPGSITSKPQGVSNADWKKYQSLSDKIANRSRPISDKNQQWYDAFVAKYGTSTPPPAGGGGGGGGGGTGTPSLPSAPLDYANVGLLLRPYDNPFERRNLWNQFPGGP